MIKIKIISISNMYIDYTNNIINLILILICFLLLFFLLFVLCSENNISVQSQEKHKEKINENEKPQVLLKCIDFKREHKGKILTCRLYIDDLDPTASNIPECLEQAYGNWKYFKKNKDKMLIEAKYRIHDNMWGNGYVVHSQFISQVHEWRGTQGCLIPKCEPENLEILNNRWYYYEEKTFVISMGHKDNKDIFCKKYKITDVLDKE